jgi:hypothetical protein
MPSKRLQLAHITMFNVNEALITRRLRAFAGFSAETLPLGIMRGCRLRTVFPPCQAVHLSNASLAATWPIGRKHHLLVWVFARLTNQSKNYLAHKNPENISATVS